MVFKALETMPGARSMGAKMRRVQELVGTIKEEESKIFKSAEKAWAMTDANIMKQFDRKSRESKGFAARRQRGGEDAGGRRRMEDE
jgi:hypothetical protein